MLGSAPIVRVGVQAVMKRAVMVPLILVFVLIMSLSRGGAEPTVVEVEKVVEVVREVQVPIEVEVPVEIERKEVVEVEKPQIVEVVKEIEVERVVEVVKEVEVEVERVVEKVLIATPTPPPAGTPQYGGTLRVVSQGSIASLDPIFTIFYVTHAVSSHIYETPFGWDENYEVRPRLVDSWTVSPDSLEHTFFLRPGVTFHDGRSLTANDVVGSINRWLSTGCPGAGVVRNFETDTTVSAIDDGSFKITLTEPVGSLVGMLGAPYCTSFVVPSELAATPNTEAMAENIGTGPYKFVEWTQGHQVILNRHEGYVPRSEPGSNYAGASNAYLDRIVFLEIPDEATKISGLQTGEWDVVDGAAFDYFQSLNEDPAYSVPLYAPGNRSHMYLNVTHAPFDVKGIRQALQAAVDVEQFMFALGPDDLWVSCAAMFWCGTPLEVYDGEEFYDQDNPELAAQMLIDSGYAGETTVILNPTDYATITPLGLVLQPLMKEIGFNVEMPAIDWSTVVSNFGTPETFALATAWYSHFEGPDPTNDHLISGTVSWLVQDEEFVELQLRYAQEPDPEVRMEVLREIQRQRYDKVPNVMLGQFFPMTPTTAALKNFHVRPLPLFINAWLER